MPQEMQKTEVEGLVYFDEMDTIKRKILIPELGIDVQDVRFMERQEKAWEELNDKMLLVQIGDDYERELQLKFLEELDEVCLRFIAEQEDWLLAHEIHDDYKKEVQVTFLEERFLFHHDSSCRRLPTRSIHSPKYKTKKVQASTYAKYCRTRMRQADRSLRWSQTIWQLL